MAKLLRSELLELFLQEVESYLPEIRKGLSALAGNRSAIDVLAELHRLFHNIKGAASQVQLTDLSKAAKKVENLLDKLVEEGRGISDSLLAALDLATEMIEGFITRKDASPEDEAALYQEMASLLDEFTGNGERQERDDQGVVTEAGKNPQQACLGMIRSILPLLLEMAEYLRPDDGLASNVKVYSKLSQACGTLAGATQACGYLEQHQLLHDFHLLLEDLRIGLLPHHPEMPALITDFLRFLEAVYACSDPENSTTLGRVKDQLRGLHSLLNETGRAQKDEWLTGYPDSSPVDEDIFASSSTADDEAVELLQELDDSELFGEPTEEFEQQEADGESLSEDIVALEETGQKEETLTEEQELLLEIFRSECDEHLIVINHSLNILEGAVTAPLALSQDLRETLSVLRRAVHTLKGAAAMTGVNLMARGAHALEDMLDWLHDDAQEITPEEIQVIATGIDVIELLSQSPETAESVHLDRLIGTIDGYLAEKSAADDEDALDFAQEPIPELLFADDGDEVDSTAGPIPESRIPDEDRTVILPGDSGVLRVKLDDLDELVGIEGELVVARGAMEKMVEEFAQTLIELDNVKENLRRKSQELESGFEVQSLYGVSPVIAGGSVDETTGDFSEFDPIELDRYSQLNLIIRSLNEISVDVNSIYTTLTSLAGDISGQVGKQQLTMRLMQDKLMRIRMTPMSSLSRVLYRTVRETTRKLRKKANLVITGEDVYMDRFVWAKITDPLMHILRNAVDHGIETPQQRVLAGKTEIGTIRVEAVQKSRFVSLRISDDGGGIDLLRVKERLRSEGLATNPDALGEKELLEFLFHPSFTTREDVSTISGRGIGLDVVRRNIQELRGTVELINTPGKGVTFEFHIPFTLSVNRAIMVAVAGNVYAVPLQDIQQVRRFGPKELENRNGPALRVGEAVIPVTNLGFFLQLENKIEQLQDDRTGLLAILFMKGETQYAVSVEEIVEQREIIVKNLGSHLTHVPGISGVTLTGAGTLIPILNLRELVAGQKAAPEVAIESAVQMALHDPLKVLIVDDSISVRHSVARLVEGKGWKQQQAIDGLDALAKLEASIPDVIILDIEMPRMNGYELKSNLNNNPDYKDIPVIMLTSRVSEKHQQKAKELGIEYYMTKPYQEDSFIRLLENIHFQSIN